MATYYQSPINAWFQGFTAQGVVLQSGKLYTYLAGTTTPQATYTTSAGSLGSSNSNPIILGTDGRPPNEIWVASGIALKFILQDSNSNTLATWDNVANINDVSSPALSEWQDSGYTTGTGLAYASATQFTVTTATDLTATGTSQIFAAGRRIRATVTAGSSYATITSSSYGAGVNTINVDTTNSIALDSGLSAVAYSVLNSINTSAGPDATNSKGASIASATSTNIWASGGDWVHITGTTTITGFGTAAKAGQFRKITFDGILTLTNGSNLVIPGGVSITTAAGDTALVVADTTTKAVVVSYTKFNGGATPSMIADFFTTTAPNGWLECDGSSQLIASYPVLSAIIRPITGGADGTHFYLPNMSRRARVGRGGAGTGTLGNAVGDTGGEETHTLITAEMPSHVHIEQLGSGVPAGTGGAGGNSIGNAGVGSNYPGGHLDTLATGGDGTHNNIQPSIIVMTCIAY